VTNLFLAVLLTFVFSQGADAIPRVLEIMNQYYLTRDDWDAIIELTTLVEGAEPKIDSKVKAAFTRE